MEAATLTVQAESFPIRGTFRIARGARRVAEVVVAEVRAGGLVGRGEGLPYGRYGETVAGVIAALEGVAPAVAAGAGRHDLDGLLPTGAARNALDCALWDLEAKMARQPAWVLAGLSRPPVPLTTAYTLSVDTPEAMASAARAAVAHPLLKLKLAGGAAGEDVARVTAVRRAVPRARLMADANEAWTPEYLVAWAPALAALGVELLEQPLPAGQESALPGYRCPVPLAADESCHGPADMARLAGFYRVVNLKLDKAGGLTPALDLAAAAKAAGLEIMVGCMVATSLAMAPALLLAQEAAFVDLDGPLLLERDRSPGLCYDGATVHPPTPALWG